MFETWLFLRGTPRSDLSYQAIHLLIKWGKKDMFSQNLPSVVTRREEFSLNGIDGFAQKNYIKWGSRILYESTIIV